MERLSAIPFPGLTSFPSATTGYLTIPPSAILSSYPPSPAPVNQRGACSSVDQCRQLRRTVRGQQIEVRPRQRLLLPRLNKPNHTRSNRSLILPCDLAVTLEGKDGTSRSLPERDLTSPVSIPMGQPTMGTRSPSFERCYGKVRKLLPVYPPAPKRQTFAPDLLSWCTSPSLQTSTE